ncbi:MAG: hypothetical protein ACI4L9_02535 [Candidatus Coproplasma sp.]
MFTLLLDRPKYIRVRAGITPACIRSEFVCPVPDDVFDGCIVSVTGAPCEYYSAQPGDDYKIIAVKLRCDEEEIRRLNGNAPVYPSKKVFFARRSGG